jgi:hypothetical protein
MKHRVGRSLVEQRSSTRYLDGLSPCVVVEGRIIRRSGAAGKARVSSAGFYLVRHSVRRGKEIAR